MDKMRSVLQNECVRYHKRCEKATTKMEKIFTAVFPRMRELKGSMSVSAFARAVGINQQTMDTYMKGRLPSLEVAARMASTFDVSLDWLLGLTDDRRGATPAGATQDVAALQMKIHDLEVENAALRDALSLIGGRRAPVAKTGGSPATKTA